MSHLKKFTKLFAIMLPVVCVGGVTWGEVCQDIRTSGDFALAVDAPLADVRDALLECYPQELVDGFGWCISVPVVLEIPLIPEDDDDQGRQGRRVGGDRGAGIRAALEKNDDEEDEDEGDDGETEGDLIICGGVPPDYPGFVIQDPFGVGFDALLFNNPGLYQTEAGNICALEHGLVNEDTFVAERWLGVVLDKIVGGSGDFSDASGWLAGSPLFYNAPSTFWYEGWICTP